MIRTQRRHGNNALSRPGYRRATRFPGCLDCDQQPAPSPPCLDLEGLGSRYALLPACRFLLEVTAGQVVHDHVEALSATGLLDTLFPASTLQLPMSTTAIILTALTAAGLVLLLSAVSTRSPRPGTDARAQGR